MDLDLSGKRALVTGSTRGIGLATAVGLTRMGAEVLVNGRTAGAVQEAIARIGQQVPGAKTHAAAIDLGTAKGCAQLIEQFPAVDILVNNLGIYEPKPFFEVPDEDWSRMFEVNVMSGVRLTRHYLKVMLETMDWGRVVFVSSESAIFVPKEMVHYGFSKAARTFTERRPARCCSVTRAPRSPPTSSATYARGPRARPMARRCAPMAASSPIRSNIVPCHERY